MRQRINWKVAVPVTLVGIVLVVWGLALGKFTRSTVSGTLIQFGSVFGLVLVVVLIEPRLFRRVREAAKAVAQETVERETADLRDRVVRLENLDEAQATERQRRRQEADDAIRRLVGDEVSPETVGHLLATGYEQNLFDGGEFRVRTSTQPKCHVLYMLAVKDDAGIVAIWLDFKPIHLGLTGPRHGPDRAPVESDSTVIWTNGQSPEQVASDLEAALERGNEPLYGFSLSWALAQLAESHRVMTNARAAEADSPMRLRGSLQLLINELWAITSYGLERLGSASSYPVKLGGFHGSRYVGTQVTVPAPDSTHGLDDALRWVTERERWEVLRPEKSDG